LLKSGPRGWRWVGIIVVVLPIVLDVVVGDMVPCVGYLNYEHGWDKEYPKEQ
jgi:hypothetical protein